MHPSSDVRSPSELFPTGNAPPLLRWLCTSNPFYVLSAGLFLIGLYISFGAQAEAAETWALMSGLAGYTLLLAAGFYAYAALRQAPAATEVLTGVLVLLSVVGPLTGTDDSLVGPRPLPILAAALLQLALGQWQSSTVRCLLGAAGLVVVAALVLPEVQELAPYFEPVLFHLTLLALLTLGILFDDTLARLLRLAGALLVLAACLVVLFIGLDRYPSLPPWLLVVYPLALAVLLAGYGFVLGHRSSLAISGLALLCWLAVCGWWGYGSLRQVVAGLDYLALSLLLFTVALLLSAAKSGILRRAALSGEQVGSS